MPIIIENNMNPGLFAFHLLLIRVFGIIVNTFFVAGVAQLVRAPDCGSGCRGFESRLPPHHSRRERTMSQHRSLKGSSKITAKRNVLKRFERINLLAERGQWKPGDRGQGLRKTKPAE